MSLERSRQIVSSTVDRARSLTRGYKEFLMGERNDEVLTLAARSATLTGSGIVLGIAALTSQNEYLAVIGLGLALAGYGTGMRSYVRAAYGI